MTTVLAVAGRRSGMLYDAVEDPATYTRAELRAAYEDELSAVVEVHGIETVAAESGVDEERLRALVDGDSPDITVEEAGAILAVSEEYPDADAVVAELQDHLLLGMTTGVLDVDTVAANVQLDLSGQEIQQSLEGRRPTTLTELAAIHRFVAERNER